MISVPPTDLQINDAEVEQLENIPVDIHCIIARALPLDEVSVYWTQLSSEEREDAGTPAVELNDDGTYQLTYTTTLVFTRKDHNQLLTCHATWRNVDDYASVNINVTVQCECCT